MSPNSLAKHFPEETPKQFLENGIVFEIPSETLRDSVRHLEEEGHRLSFMTAADLRTDRGSFFLYYIFSVLEEASFIILSVSLGNSTTFSSIADLAFTASEYERRIQDLFGLIPTGHPHPQSILLHESFPEQLAPLRKDFDARTSSEKKQKPYSFQEVQGEGIYEVSVGPIHAGIIEPGHFRFSVAGEEIMLLEPRLGYVHKGSEKLFETLSLPDTLRLSEKLSGDSSFSHSLAFCQALESLADISVPARDRYLRVLYAELERLANHIGDIGAMMLDTGFSFGGSHGARIREKVLRLNDLLTGSRFLRDVNTLGGVTRDLDEEKKILLKENILAIKKDFFEVIAHAEASASLINRLKDTGILSEENAQKCGAEGVAGRASGIEKDLRFDLPYAAYNELTLGKKILETHGDVYARFHVRIKEVSLSIALILEVIDRLPEISLTPKKEITSFKKNALALGCVEGWRGPILSLVITDAQGNLTRVAPRDPSVVNWYALGFAGPGNIIPDFPLINKSFNLSYSGNDL